MGVTGDVLSRIIRTAGRKVNLSDYSDGIEDASSSLNMNKNKRRKFRPLRIGLDVSTWIAGASHGKGSMLVDDRHLTNYGRAELSRGDRIPQLEKLTTEENRQHYVQVCTQQVLSRIISLQSFSKSDMLIILDGASPPIKKEENQRRAQRKRRAEAARDADVDMDDADPDPDKALGRRLRAARQAGAGFCYSFIVAEIMQQLREHEIAFIVSPYEADGQLAYLAQCGMVDLVMTEDSDLLCHDIETVVFKYDLEGGGMLVQRHDLGAAELQSKSLSLQDFSTAMIAVMFVCIGCDYCDSLMGIGAVSARNIVRDVFAKKDPKKAALRLVFDALYSSARAPLSSQERQEYEERFMAALFAYQHPIVFCPIQGKCIVSNEPPDGGDPVLLEYEPYASLCHNVEKQHAILGVFPERRLQLAMTEGWISPRTNQPYPHVELPEHIQNLIAPPPPSGCLTNIGQRVREVLQEHYTMTASGQSATTNDQKGSEGRVGTQETRPRSIESEESSIEEEYDDTPETQCEQKASEDIKEVRRSSSQEEELSPPESQFFETQQQQPRARAPFAESTQAFQSQKSANSCSTPGSSFAQCQQSSQRSDVGRQHQQQLSSQNSTGEVKEMVENDGNDDDDVTVSYPLPPGWISSLNQLGSPNPAGSQDRTLYLTQDNSKSPSQVPSTQSSRTTLGGNSSTKIASQSTASTRSDFMSPPLLPGRSTVVEEKYNDLSRAKL